LFIIGDVNPDEAITHARALFEPIPGAQKTYQPEFPAPQSSLSAQYTKFYEDIKTEQLGFYWRIPGTKNDDELDAHYVWLHLLRSSFGAGFVLDCE